ncbi:MAG: hypothetical protein CDJEALGM_01800 [Ignavibacteria bacterium]|nr:hypothetical protein [Ignavibacteria bacterium]
MNNDPPIFVAFDEAHIISWFVGCRVIITSLWFVFVLGRTLKFGNTVIDSKLFENCLGLSENLKSTGLSE